MHWLIGTKKLKCFSAGVLISTALTFSAFAAVKDKPVASIDVVTPPQRITYGLGEDVDLYGIKVKVTFTDGEELIADYNDLTCAGYDPQQLGSQLILVQYGQASAPFTVTVKDSVVNGLDITFAKSGPWISGTKLKASDLNVKAILDTGAKQTVTDFDFEPKLLQTGRNVITVTYGAVKSTVSLEAYANECQSIRIAKPGKQEFDVGELFSWQGLQVIGHFRDGSEADVTSACSVTGVNTGKAGKYYAEVTYEEKKATYEVNVIELSFKELDVSMYKETGAVELYFNERSEPVIVPNEDISVQDNNETGVRSFYVTYKGSTYTKDVEIPEDERIMTGSNHILVQVPIGVSVKADSNGYIQKTLLKSAGDKKTKVTIGDKRESGLINGLPAVIHMPAYGNTELGLDLILENLTESLYVPFSIKVEVEE